jgi:hypothetical protein
MKRIAGGVIHKSYAGWHLGRFAAVAWGTTRADCMKPTGR